jgi:hypothetical protein
MAADDHAIVVGITKYPALGDLQGPENDANDFATWLVEPGGGNVPQANIKTIVSSKYPASGIRKDAQPQLAAISTELELLAEGALLNGRVGRRLYLYLAGHGFAQTIEDAVLLMANAAVGFTGFNIPGRTYANWFTEAGAFDEVILFMDCCREATMLAQKNEPPWDRVIGGQAAERYYTFATQWSRAAREGPWGTNGAPRGIFTLALMSGLRGGAERDADGQVTGQALESYVINYIRNDPRAFTSGEARPDPDFVYRHAGYTMLFNAPPGEPPQNAAVVPAVQEAAAPPTEYRVRVTIASPNGHQFQLFDGEGQLLAPRQQTPAAWEWSVAKVAMYKVQRDDGVAKIVEVIGDREVFDVDF